jgi:DNA repair exonuclease SbcCD ATPase subunit
MECLKFAITGDVPPVNHSSGKTFVHDPQSLPRCTTEALVELHFTDQEGQERIVARPMEARPQKKNHTALSFQQLDGTLLFAVQDGNRVIEEEVVLPCSELNRQVPLLLGVANDSGALIDHVLFCSQDDSLWPLQQTGSVLKERFDAIVGSTRYSKALSALADLQNQYASRARDLKAEQATISIHRQAAMESRDKLSRLESNMEWVEQDIQELQKEELEIKDEEQRLRQKAVKLKGENHRIGWSATVDDDLASLRVRHTAIGSAIARLEGRRSAFVESIRTAKVRTCMGAPYQYVVCG